MLGRDKIQDEKHYGSAISKEGVKIYFTQNPYIEMGPNDSEPLYRALAYDDRGEQYLVTWKAYHNWMDIEDESDCCDWEDYDVEMLF